MSNDSEPRSPLDLPESERTNKPLIIECDYNTRRQNLAFDSARDCSCDELRAKIKESFRLTSRPFKVRWDDDDGEQNYIQDEDTLDDAIQYYHSSDGSSVTMFVKISLEYDGPSHSGASPLVGKEADSAEGLFAHGEISKPQQDVATISKDTGKSTQNSLPLSLPWEPPWSHIPSSDSCAFSIDEGATGRSIIDGSTDASSLTGSAEQGDSSPVLEYLKHQEYLKRQEQRNASSSRQPSFPTGWQKAWVQSQGPDPLMDALDDSRSLLSGSFSLNTDSPMSEAGLPDPGTLHQRRDDYSSYRSVELAEYSEHEALVNGSHGRIAHESPLPQKVSYCSECDCILDLIKYVCTTCGEKTPTARAAHIESAAAREKRRNSEASSSPTRTILGRSLGSSGSSSSTARAGYELCAACFESVGVDHSWASCVSGIFSTPKELTIARRSPPKQDGQLRHAFVEQVPGPHGWIDLEQEEMARQCFICENELSADRYKCPNGDCNNFTICRGCFSKVHNIHPIHPFLDMRVKPASQTQNHLEISDEFTTGDNADEPSLKPLGFQCSYCQQDIVGDLMLCTKKICKGIKLCSNCDGAGVYGTPESGHSSSHTMFKIPMKSDGTHDVSEQAYGERHGQDDPADLGPTPDTEETCIHTQSCNSCEEIIVGARYQCLNCPSKPTSFNLCSDCEVKSYKDHDPMHTFLRIPRRVDIPGPLESEFPILPILYRSPAGPRPFSNTPDDPAAYLRNLTHGDFVLCDSHMGKIVGKWYRCALCPKDLCAGCEELDAHDSTHPFIVFKAPVDERAFRNFADEENPAGSPPVLHGNIYHPQHE